MRNHLRIRLGLESVAAGDELIAQVAEVLDDAVVDDRDAAGAIAMGVGVEIARATVRGPASVAQADPCTGRVAAEGVRQNGHLTGSLLNEQVSILGDEGDAGGVVAPVLEASQPIEQDRSSFSGSGVADDSAHTNSLQVSGTAATGEGG